MPQQLGYISSAFIFGLCTLQKLVPFGSKPRWISICLILALVISYIAEGIYYLTEHGWIPPQHRLFHILSCILVWGNLTGVISIADSVLWQPYLGVPII
jgi:hypothetical protein